MAKSKAKLMLAVPAAPQVSAGKKRKKKVKKGLKAVKSGVRALTPYLQLLADPWNGEIAGAQCPDTNRLPTLTWKERHVETLATDAQGNIFQTLKTTLKSMLVGATLDANAISTVHTARDIANYPALSTTFNSYRCYSVATTLTYIGQQDLEKGMFWGATCTVQPQVGGTATHYVDEPDYKEVGAEEEISVVIRHHGADFSLVTNATPENTNKLYGVVGCTGLPASTFCVRMETVWTGEVTLDATQLMARGASYSPTHPVQVDAGANIIGPYTTTAIGKGSRDKLVKHAKKAATIGAELNGLWQTAQSYGPMVEQFASLFV